MNDSGRIRARPLHVERYGWALAVVWTVVVGASLAWNVVKMRDDTIETARVQARTVHGKDLIVWGMALTCVLLAAAVVVYLTKKEYWERMIAAFQAWRASLPDAEREKMDVAMNALQPPLLKDAIRTTKNVLGLRSASG